MTFRLDPAIVRQTLQGYSKVNQITEAERRTRLKEMTEAEALEAFASLYRIWKRTGQQAGGEWQPMREHHLRVRRAIHALAKHMGLI